MAHLVEAHRAVLLEGRLPDGGALAGLSITAIAVLAAGWIAFRRLRHTVPELL
jgi:ABC-type polysaccharide/polyol phosphate export permease